MGCGNIYKCLLVVVVFEWYRYICEVDFTFVMKKIALNKKKYRPWAWVVKGIPVHYGPAWGEN